MGAMADDGDGEHCSEPSNNFDAERPRDGRIYTVTMVVMMATSTGMTKLFMIK